MPVCHKMVLAALTRWSREKPAHRNHERDVIGGLCSDRSRAASRSRRKHLRLGGIVDDVFGIDLSRRNADLLQQRRRERLAPAIGLDV
jgi:hypothetical protein